MFLAEFLRQQTPQHLNPEPKQLPVAQVRASAGGWGRVDDNGTQTHPTLPPQEPFYSVSTVLSSCRTFLHNLNSYFWSMLIRDVGDEMCLRFRDVGDDDVDDHDGV